MRAQGANAPMESPPNLDILCDVIYRGPLVARGGIINGNGQTVIKKSLDFQ